MTPSPSSPAIETTTSTGKIPVHVTATISEVDTSSDSAEATVGLVAGLVLAFVIMLIGVIIVTICLATLFVKKRKLSIRNLQLEALTR